MKNLILLSILSLSFIACGKGGHMDLPKAASASADAQPTGKPGITTDPAVSDTLPNGERKVFYDPTILDLVSRNCSGCHGKLPNIPNWSKWDDAKGHTQRMYDLVINHMPPSMPLGGKLSDTDYNNFKKWLDEGKPKKASGKILAPSTTAAAEVAPAAPTAVASVAPAAPAVVAAPAPALEIKGLDCASTSKSETSDKKLQTSLTADFGGKSVSAKTTLSEAPVEAIAYLKVNDDKTASVCQTDIKDFSNCTVEQNLKDAAGADYYYVSCKEDKPVQLTIMISATSARLICNNGDQAFVANFNGCKAKN